MKKNNIIPILHIHDSGYLPREDEKIKFLVICQHKVPYIEFIQKDATELIARDVLNCSTVLMKEYKPFKKTRDESNGESDNIGKDYEIDTKLLMLNELCYLISKDDSAYYKNNQVWEIFFDIYVTYAKYKGIIITSHSSLYEKNQLRIIQEIERKLVKFNNKKNLLFIYPIPQCDFLGTLDRGLKQEKTYDFQNSYISIFVEVLSLIKKDINFNNDLYFAYCLYDGTYNLVKVENEGYISEAFIPVNKQKDFLEAKYVGMEDSKGIHRFYVERSSKTNHLITTCIYSK
ncbi:hypothetical protein [Faecalitalea cylindroides]|uniref:hypothetical protein n=1 Tax=Faecalitalea cylindroides TaxID=39483 RepID=UPI0024917B89|nr:hypothetical protein [Faecalitalea cylindroides]